MADEILLKDVGAAFKKSGLSLGTVVDGQFLKRVGSSIDSDDAAASPHALGGSDHSSDTLANLNGKISDATLIDTGDSRLSDARTPTAHKDSHKSGGSDPFASTDLLEAVIKRIRESGGQDLLLGAVADGEFLKRVGTDIVGASAAALNVSLFTMGFASGSLATGALGFTPLAAFYTYSTHKSGASGVEVFGVGWATGTAGSARQSFTGGSGLSPAGGDASSIGGDAGSKFVDVTAFAAGGITLTWTAGVTGHTGYLLVIG